MERKRKYRRFLMICLALDFLAIGVLGVKYLDRKVPDEIHVEDVSSLNLQEQIDCPIVQFDEAITASAGNGYTVSSNILGVIPFKDVKVTQTEREYVYASGSVIGIYMETDGVLVIDSGEIVQKDGSVKSPAKDIVEAGDYIVAFNEEKIENKQDLMQELKNLSNEVVTLQVKRGKSIIPLSIKPVKDANENYKLGIWVRDDTQGLGTLTFVDSQGNYGALGHGSSDIDTGELLDIQTGKLYGAEILAIKKGDVGSPGELAGLIRYEKRNVLGSILDNTSCGIFGKLTDINSNKIELEKMPIAYKQEVEIGAATILCTIDDEVREYQAEIEKIDMNHEDSNKSFVVRVTDEELLAETGGIIQGLSGSPIVQNGKLVGAVTHVLVNDPTRGYGIFIENMLDNAE